MKTQIHFLSPTRSRAGFTLIEVVVAAGIASIVFAAVALFSAYTARSFVAIGNYAELDGASRNALDVMSREIRQTRGLITFKTNQVAFQDYDNVTLTYTWDPVTATLKRTKSGSTTTLLKQCDFLNFGISQRNPSNNFNFYPTTNIANAKLIDVNWSCSRGILQRKVNTESVQTAKIVIRNQP
jgi:prepilin-type N-terminal cleavage/methylation domain-containing protein